MIEMIFDAIYTAVTPPILLWIFLGILVGIVLGATPGIGPIVGMAIILPFTAPIGFEASVTFFVAIYLGAMYGSSIASILINTPGTAASAATTLDGYPMTREGRAAHALILSAMSSSFGGLISGILLLFMSFFIIDIVLLMGAPEYFLVAMFGILLIPTVASGNVLKGIISGALGLLLTTIGYGVITVRPRFIFGNYTLLDGISFVSVLIGIFAISEMIRLSGERGGIAKREISEFSYNLADGWKSIYDNKIDVVKSSLIGMGIGMIPGSGAAVANFVAWSEGKRSDKNPESFGEGNERGVITSEASNSSVVAGSLIPTLSFGIPGSAATAVLLGALIMHGVQPGPGLFTDQLDFLYVLFFSLIVGNIIVLFVGLSIITRSQAITRINSNILIPVILVLATLGTFALRDLWFDLIVLYIVGILGLVLIEYNYSIITLVLGMVLGPLIEENFVRSMQISDYSPMIFIDSIISLTLTLLIVVVVLFPIMKFIHKNFY